MKEEHNYRINEHQCSEDPLTIEVFDNGKSHIYITVAEKKGRWAYGYDYSIQGGCAGGSLPCFNCYRESFETQDKAEKAALLLLLSYNAIRGVAALERACRARLTPQLTLF